MKELFNLYYMIKIDDEELVDGKVHYKSNECVYTIIPIQNKKAIVMEQVILAYYLIEMGYVHIARPVRSTTGDWLTTYNGKEYIVVQINNQIRFPLQEHGFVLATFHQLLSAHEYEPKTISSYGKWKDLWIKKLTFFERKIISEAEKQSNEYYRFLMDVLPYIIGISENAIQYIQESERDIRYGSSDKGTVTFMRYESHLFRPTIWPNELVYDHLTRDIAEFIRKKFLKGDERTVEEIYAFLKQYETIQPLTPFSWRMLYGRLLYPVHIFDLIERGFYLPSLATYHLKLANLLEAQIMYESRVSQLFEMIEQHDKNLRIPAVQWLKS